MNDMYFPGLPKRNPGLKFANSFGVVENQHRARSRGPSLPAAASVDLVSLILLVKSFLMNLFKGGQEVVNFATANGEYAYNMALTL